MQPPAAIDILQCQGIIIMKLHAGFFFLKDTMNSLLKLRVQKKGRKLYFWWLPQATDGSRGP
jgi:hypothetical protein